MYYIHNPENRSCTMLCICRYFFQKELHIVGYLFFVASYFCKFHKKNGMSCYCILFWLVSYCTDLSAISLCYITFRCMQRLQWWIQLYARIGRLALPHALLPKRWCPHRRKYQTIYESLLSGSCQHVLL